MASAIFLWKCFATTAQNFVTSKLKQKRKRSNNRAATLHSQLIPLVIVERIKKGNF